MVVIRDKNGKMKAFVEAANEDAPKKKRPAPKENKSFRLAPAVIEAIDEVALASGRSFAEVHRELLAVGMQMRGIEIKR